jgi:hypothetical protein
MTRPAAWIAAGIVAAAGCASVQTGRARAEYLTRELDAVRYAQPLDEVWDEARRLLADRGYPLVGADAKAVGQSDVWLTNVFSPGTETRSTSAGATGLLPNLLSRPSGGTADDDRGARFLETGWSRNRDRYRVDGWRDGPDCRVTFTAILEDRTEHQREAGRHRDLEMELDLARRLDPEAAARIEAGLAALGGPKS